MSHKTIIVKQKESVSNDPNYNRKKESHGIKFKSTFNSTTSNYIKSKYKLILNIIEPESSISALISCEVSHKILVTVTIKENTPENTYSYICPSNDEFCFFTHEE